ncbi:response regulator transcription factor [Novosphingobium sp. TH158]|uniref:response regulator transcription factor n=1 Tax=Novosphingobium sp. TH158 TaxID=2067455 RepID=UPI000C7E0AB2|nr:response regulator transcription factor [Novosphingobium sp. TH158]PLK25874.1 DNA-binding response regulator [Novosphingobium sp. TH158]
MRIALVDDDPDEIVEIADSLRASGCECTLYSSGEELLAALRRETFDALLLDWNMMGMSGMKVLAWARENLNPPPPVIMLTNRDRKEDIVFALDAGAADYIRKPEDPDIVRARIRAALRERRKDATENDGTFGGFEFDSLTRVVTYDGEGVELRQKEYALARLLFENLNRPLSRSYILQKVWQSSPDVETRTLDVHISRLRAKLKLKPERGFALQTIFGFGYRLDSLGASAE